MIKEFQVNKDSVNVEQEYLDFGYSLEMVDVHNGAEEAYKKAMCFVESEIKKATNCLS